MFGCTAPRNGCSAQFVAVFERETAPKPAGLSWIEAAALPTVAATAYRGVVTMGKASALQRVLIHGCAGGVGSAMAMIARSRGCNVWGTCSPSNAEYLKSIGVCPLDYAQPDQWGHSAARERSVDTIARSCRRSGSTRWTGAASSTSIQEPGSGS